MFRTMPALSMLLVAAAATQPVAAQSLRAYAGVAAGQVSGPGNCGTFQPSIPEWSAGLTLPLAGIAGCNLGGGEDNHVAASGTLTAQQGGFGQVVDGSYQGTASARAGYGSLGVAAQGTMTGGINGGGTLHQSAAFASFSDRLTFTSPLATPGDALQVLFGWTVSGSMSGQGRAPFGQYASVSLNTRVNGRDTSPDFVSVISIGGNPFYSPTPVFLENNFTIGGGQISGSGRVRSQFFYDVQVGTPFTLTTALATFVQPCCFGTTMDSSFLQSAHLTSIRVFRNRTEITDFAIQSASGTLYTGAGVVAVPEPGAGLLALAGLGVVAWRARRTRQR